jgi:hypothetical protein
LLRDAACIRALVKTVISADASNLLLRTRNFILPSISEDVSTKRQIKMFSYRKKRTAGAKLMASH